MNDKLEFRMIIMRGIPGSGKSTLAKELGKNGVVLSTDDYFMKGDEYQFVPAQLPIAHAWNQKRTQVAIDEKQPLIVIDNTNIAAWHALPYVIMAKNAGYAIEIVEPQTSWWKTHRQGMSSEEKANLAKILTEKTKHGVPYEIISAMLNNWEHDFTNKLMSNFN